MYFVSGKNLNNFLRLSLLTSPTRPDHQSINHSSIGSVDVWFLIIPVSWVTTMPTQHRAVQLHLVPFFPSHHRTEQNRTCIASPLVLFYFVLFHFFLNGFSNRSLLFDDPFFRSSCRFDLSFCITDR